MPSRASALFKVIETMSSMSAWAIASLNDIARTSIVFIVLSTKGALATRRDNTFAAASSPLLSPRCDQPHFSHAAR